MIILGMNLDGFSPVCSDICQNNTRGVGKTNTFGLNVDLTEDYAQHFTLLLVPEWDRDPVSIGERTALVYFN